MREASACEPLMKCRKEIRRWENRRTLLSRERPRGSCLTDATRGARSQRTARVLPLWCRPNAYYTNRRGSMTRWNHFDLRVRSSLFRCCTDRSPCQVSLRAALPFGENGAIDFGPVDVRWAGCTALRADFKHFCDVLGEPKRRGQAWQFNSKQIYQPTYAVHI